MPPAASDPKELRLILNPARRKAFTLLIGSMVAQMRKSIEYSFDGPSSAANIPASTSQTIPRDLSPSSSEIERQKRLESRLDGSLPTQKMNALERDALRYFDRWSDQVRVELRKITDGPDDRGFAQRREDWRAHRNSPPPPYTPTANPPNKLGQEASTDNSNITEAKDVSMTQSLYHPITTRFTTISKDDKVHVISCMVLLLLSLGHYSAHSRTLLCILTSSFALPISVLITEETEISRTLLLASKTMTADVETRKRAQENQTSRRWKVGLASVAGAALIGVTGGIAAPVVAGAIGGLMGGIGLGGVASVLGIFAMNGAFVGTLFGAFGGKMTGEMVDAYAKEVEDFNFIPVASEWGEQTSHPQALDEARRLRVTIGINGWLDVKEDIVRPWRVLGRDSEVFALRYEMDALLTLGHSLKDMVSSYAWSYVKLEILKRTVLASLWSALWPVYLLKMATSLDTPFSVAKHRSEKAGEVLADVLINKAQGERPVTLIGYSLGARVIYCCLKSLAERRAFGIVENVILIGAPVPSNYQNWQEMRAVVSGKLVNVHSKNDYILAFLYRATSIQYGVAGLQEIKDLEGVVNEDLSEQVSGHLRYPDLVGKILKRIGVEHVDVEDEEIKVDPEIKVVDNEDLIDFGYDTADAIPLAADRMKHPWFESSTDKTASVERQADYGGPQSGTASSDISAMMASTDLAHHSPPSSSIVAPTHRGEMGRNSPAIAPSVNPLLSDAPSPIGALPPYSERCEAEDNDHYSLSDDGGIVMEDNDEALDGDVHGTNSNQGHHTAQTNQHRELDISSATQLGREGSCNQRSENTDGTGFDEPKSLGGLLRPS
jgi:MFS family permease